MIYFIIALTLYLEIQSTSICIIVCPGIIQSSFSLWYERIAIAAFLQKLIRHPV